MHGKDVQNINRIRGLAKLMAFRQTLTKVENTHEKPLSVRSIAPTAGLPPISSATMLSGPISIDPSADRAALAYATRPNDTALRG